MSNTEETLNASELEHNKRIVLRFNREVIEQGSERAAQELLAPDFVNRSAAPGISAGPDGMIQVIVGLLHSGLSNIKVEIHDQIAERDKVTTRKTIRGTHTGELMGILPTNESVAIDVIDIVRVENGRYAEHWGSNNLASVLQRLQGVHRAQRG